MDSETSWAKSRPRYPCSRLNQKVQKVDKTVLFWQRCAPNSDLNIRKSSNRTNKKHIIHNLEIYRGPSFDPREKI